MIEQRSLHFGHDVAVCMTFLIFGESEEDAHPSPSSFVTANVGCIREASDPRQIYGTAFTVPCGDDALRGNKPPS